MQNKTHCIFDFESQNGGISRTSNPNWPSTTGNPSGGGRGNGSSGTRGK